MKRKKRGGSGIARGEVRSELGEKSLFQRDKKACAELLKKEKEKRLKEKEGGKKKNLSADKRDPLKIHRQLLLQSTETSSFELFTAFFSFFFSNLPPFFLFSFSLSYSLF